MKKQNKFLLLAVCILILIFSLSCSKKQQPPEDLQETTQETLKTVTTEEEISAPLIDGLRFDQEIKKYIAESNNPYGLEVGVEAGLLVENAAEIDGKMEDCVGLDAKVIEYLQDRMYEETKDRLLPIIFDLSKSKNIKIKELKSVGAEIDAKVLGINVPVGGEFLAPLSESWIMFRPFPNLEDKYFFTNWDIGVEGKLGRLEIYFRDAEILAEMEEGAQFINPKEGRIQTLMRTKTKLGDPLGRITKDTPLENFSKSDWGDYQIVTFLTGKDESTNGLEGVMEVGKGPEALKVFVFK